MQTLKEVLSRQEERQNLMNVVFCVLLILGVIFVSFVAAYVRFFPHKRAAESRQEMVAGEPHLYP